MTIAAAVPPSPFGERGSVVEQLQLGVAPGFSGSGFGVLASGSAVWSGSVPPTSGSSPQSSSASSPVVSGVVTSGFCSGLVVSGWVSGAVSCGRSGWTSSGTSG